MNLKDCTFERLAFISLGFGRGAQVGRKSLLEVEFITAQASTLDVFIFSFGTLQALGSHQNPRSLEEDEAFFLTMRSKDSETTHLQAAVRCCVTAKLRPRRFDSTVKRLAKLRFEPVSFLFLACFLKNKR